MGVVRGLIEEHPELKSILDNVGWAQPTNSPDGGQCPPYAGESPSEWQPLTGSTGSSLSREGLELILTGIPRSGTSHLCNLLHRYDNCVVLNEPPQVVPALSDPVGPWALGRFYRDTRRDVILGRPILNKLVDGQVTEDTARGGEQKSYTPTVTGGDFVLGMKATIPFLSRVRRFGADAASADRRVYANPYDTRSRHGRRVSSIRAKPIFAAGRLGIRMIRGSVACSARN